MAKKEKNEKVQNTKVQELEAKIKELKAEKRLLESNDSFKGIARQIRLLLKHLKHKDITDAEKVFELKEFVQNVRDF